MDIDLKLLVRICDFSSEQKKIILANIDNLPSEGQLDLWELCLSNLQSKMEVEISKRFHEGVIKGIKEKKDNNDYTSLEQDVLLELLTKAGVEARHEEIEGVRNMLETYKKEKSTALPNNSPQKTQPFPQDPVIPDKIPTVAADNKPLNSPEGSPTPTNNPQSSDSSLLKN
ncbi:MAG: hypothetical protein UT63_C0006G0019 [Candidatus Gottesmanbacteria bacterium GW2011_GWC2_39_8]|uniref:Uncharacterized protein n=1 Tax=Candidatus Gottesmanbacteria bacterium GW2011_GWC2_39_8 TaxID=1618450 RepID=A0A0G0Q9W9_9BACT|nr:MAG: hypothetical protein UT63_C0006G0019 [Candidatus Gottesmanbacteria bacterium GW2011_GWC2_39_8]